jgi:hypothetical protein
MRIEILTGKIVPRTYKKTTERRRKQFRAELKNQIAPHGWEAVSAGTHLIFEAMGEHQPKLSAE